MKLNKHLWCPIIAIAFSILLLGCVKERKSAVCDTITSYLTFEYSRNVDGSNKFPELKSAIDVYIYDLQGKLVKHIAAEKKQVGENEFKVPITLPGGDYTFVSWLGSRNSYTIFDKSTANASMQVGHTLLRNSMLNLFNGATSLTQIPEDLYYGILGKVSLKPTESTSLHFNLIKNTNDLNLKIIGLENIATRAFDNSRYQVLMNVANGEYSFDNSISDPEKLIQYIPTSRTTVNDHLEVVFKILKLEKEVKSQIAIIDTKDNNNVVFSRNLIELLLGIPHINNNNDFEVYDQYDIVIDFNASAQVTITINGYTVEDSDHTIG